MEHAEFESQAQALFEAVREEGARELARPLASLWWSGIAAGVVMGMSVLGRAVFEWHLPEASWTPLISSLGYTFGFVIVVLGHMQLFTENTITTVLPLLNRRDLACLTLTARLWGIVFLANTVGAACVAAMFHLGLLDPTLLEHVVAVSHHGTAYGALDTFLRGIPAGLLIAAMVWITRKAGSSRFSLIVAMTWLIAAGGFSHVVAGTVEVFVLVWAEGPAQLILLLTFTAPAFFGNVVGGTLLFALLAYAQVKDEIQAST